MKTKFCEFCGNELEINASFCSNCGKQLNIKKKEEQIQKEVKSKFYKKTWFIILMLIIFFPVGLFLMWKYSNWNKYLKIGVSIFFVIAYIIGLIDSTVPKEVPNVINESAHNASSKLKDIGFSKIVLKDKDGNITDIYKFSSDNIVIKQIPNAGEKISTDTEIELIIRDLGKEKREKELEERKKKIEVTNQINALVNNDLATASNKAHELGYKIKLYSATDEKVSMDDSISKEDYANWVVTKIKSNNYDKKKVSFVVSTKEAIEMEKEAKRIEETLNSKITKTEAWLMMEKYGKLKYPYGFKLHYIMGVIASGPKDDSTWFLKANCDITNAFGAKRATVCEAYVAIAGTSVSIPYFYAY